MSDEMPVLRRRVIHPEGGRVMVKQAEKEFANINSIIARWIRTGEPPTGGSRPSYGDFTNVDDYHAAMNQLLEAQHQFAALPAHIRKHCGQDPGNFLDMVHDPERRHELEELGLVEAYVPESAPEAKEPVVETPPEE